MTVVFIEVKSAAQQVTPEPEDCHDTGPRSFATCLCLCTGCFPSVTSECRNIIFHSPSILVEQIPYA